MSNSKRAVKNEWASKTRDYKNLIFNLFKKIKLYRSNLSLLSSHSSSKFPRLSHHVIEVNVLIDRS